MESVTNLSRMLNFTGLHDFRWWIFFLESFDTLKQAGRCLFARKTRIMKPFDAECPLQKVKIKRSIRSWYSKFIPQLIFTIELKKTLKSRFSSKNGTFSHCEKLRIESTVYATE